MTEQQQIDKLVKSLREKDKLIAEYKNSSEHWQKKWGKENERAERLQNQLTAERRANETQTDRLVEKVRVKEVMIEDRDRNIATLVAKANETNT